MTIFRAIFWLGAVALFMPPAADRDFALDLMSSPSDLPFEMLDNADLVSEFQHFALHRIQQLKEERALLRTSKESRDPEFNMAQGLR